MSCRSRQVVTSLLGGAAICWGVGACGGAATERSTERSAEDAAATDGAAPSEQAFTVAKEEDGTAAYPKDRRDNRRRIGLKKSVLARLAAVTTDGTPETARSAHLLRNFRAMVPKFAAQLESAKVKPASDDPFWTTCSKTVATMGLLGALGDGEATRIAVEHLAGAAAPYRLAALAAMNESTAVATWMDKSLPRALRIRAYNYMYSVDKGASLKVGGGDRIYLDAGQESACLAIGYDWLYTELAKPENRAVLADVETALDALLRWSLALDQPFFRSDEHPVQRDSNWNPIMTGGAGLAALASLGDVTAFSCLPELARSVTGRDIVGWSLDRLARAQICRSVRSIKSYWQAFAATGSYKEGPTYWFLGMEYYVLFRDALRGVLGRDDLWTQYGELERRSAIVEDVLMYKSGAFWATDPHDASDSIGVYNYADASSTVIPLSYPFLSTAARSGDAAVRMMGLRLLDQQLRNETVLNPQTQAVTVRDFWAVRRDDFSRVFSLFLVPEGAVEPASVEPMTVFSDADHELDVARLSARSPSGRWNVFQKGGSCLPGHSQLDSGSFVLSIGETTWFNDLGKEHSKGGYPAGYFTLPPDGALLYREALRFFVKSDRSHNLVSLPNRPLRLSGAAKLVEHLESTTASGARQLTTTWDNSSLYAPVATASSRTMRLIERGAYTSLDVIDELDLASAPTREEVVAVWHVTHCKGKATGELRTLNNAREVEIKLTPEGSNTAQRLILTLQEPVGASFEVVDANPNDPTTSPSVGTAQVPPQNSNDGCSLISVRAKTSDLVSNGTKRARARFVVRISQ